MAIKPISADDSLTSPASGDLIPVVDISEPLGPDKNKSVTFSVLETYFNANLSFNNYTHPNHSGDVTSVADGATTLATNVVDMSHLSHQTQGQIIYYAASGVPTLLSAGTDGYVLTTQGTGANPVWAEAGGSDNDLDPTPNSDHTANGLTATMQVGESVVFGDVLYLFNDGKLWKAAAAEASSLPAMYIALGTITANNTGSVLLQGFVRDDTWTWTVGGLIYVDESGSGGMTQTAPSGTGEQVQIVGVATTADIIDFRPNPMLVEIV